MWTGQVRQACTKMTHNVTIATFENCPQGKVAIAGDVNAHHRILGHTALQDAMGPDIVMTSEMLDTRDGLHCRRASDHVPIEFSEESIAKTTKRTNLNETYSLWFGMVNKAAQEKY